MTTATESVQCQKPTARVRFDHVSEPGCYVEQTTGSLFRIPRDAASVGCPRLEIVSSEGPLLAKISDDPWLPISRARQLAADANLTVNF